MIDLKRLRDEPGYRAGIERKRVAAGLIDDVLAADAVQRDLLRRVEELRARQNAASKEIGKAPPDERPAKIAAAGELKEELSALVGRGIPGPTGHDKTSIVCFQRQDRPGSLLAILQEFAARAINLTKLESRPTKRSLGDYCFFIDCEGHIADEVIADALRNLSAKQGDLKFLGSYPVGGPAEAGVERRRAAGRAWKHAATWVESLRAQIREPGA